MIYITLSNNIISSIVTPTGDSYDASTFMGGDSLIKLDQELISEDALGAIFISGVKGEGDVYTSIEYLPIPSYGPELWQVVDGKWVDVRSDDSKMSEVRSLRNAQLAYSDWTQTLDAPFTIEQSAAWKTWRAELRDLTKTFPNSADALKALDDLIIKKPV